MGRLGRYEGNVMTWVRASNFKLVDRAIRYIDLLLKSEDVNLPYERIAERVYRMMASIREDQPLVLLVVKDILENPE